jgi:tRNA/tmRNA/rRNA uracil-C5-methylase (TrmA/RlmC/RlmD family)
VLRQPGLGLHRPGAFDKIVDIERCLLQPDPSNAIRNFVRDFCINQGWTFSMSVLGRFLKFNYKNDLYG